ncbi:hypothetical protein PG988_003812 [Apiospora saccharicola]
MMLAEEEAYRQERNWLWRTTTELVDNNGAGGGQRCWRRTTILAEDGANRKQRNWSTTTMLGEEVQLAEDEADRGGSWRRREL